jgi:hypothetical protein
MPEPFQPSRIIEALHRHDVRYILIGGLAAAIHGSPATTNDADICPDRGFDNLQALARALQEMDARIRTDAVDDGLPFACDAEFLSRMDVAVNLITRFGDFDISSRPAAFSGGYAELLPNAVRFDLDGIEVLVASLRDIITSKRTADRPKDHATLPILEALQDEIAYREAAGPDA